MRLLADGGARGSRRGRPGRNAAVEGNALHHALLLLNRLQRRPQNAGTDDGDFGRRSSAAVVLPAVVVAPDAFRSPWTVRAAAPVEESKLLPMVEDRSDRGRGGLHHPACRSCAHRDPSSNPRRLRRWTTWRCRSVGSRDDPRPCFTRTHEAPAGSRDAQANQVGVPDEPLVMLFMHVPAASANASASTA